MVAPRVVRKSWLPVVVVVGSVVVFLALRFFASDDLAELVVLPALVPEVPDAKIKKLRFDFAANVLKSTNSGDDRFTFDNTWADCSPKIAYSSGMFSK